MYLTKRYAIILSHVYFALRVRVRFSVPSRQLVGGSFTWSAASTRDIWTPFFLFFYLGGYFWHWLPANSLSCIAGISGDWILYPSRCIICQLELLAGRFPLNERWRWIPRACASSRHRCAVTTSDNIHCIFFGEIYKQPPCPEGKNGDSHVLLTFNRKSSTTALYPGEIKLTEGINHSWIWILIRFT